MKTEAEAIEIDQDIGDLAQRVISLHGKRWELDSRSRRVYALEMLLDGIAARGSNCILVERPPNQAAERREAKAGF